MRGQHHRHAFVFQHQQHVPNFAHQLWIKRGGNLIKQHHFGAHRQGPHNRNPLLLTARQLIGVVVHMVRQAAKINLQRRATQAKSLADNQDLPLSSELAEMGETLWSQAAGLTGRPKFKTARDGLMILLLTYHPVRISNFAALELGRTIFDLGSEFEVRFPPCEMKTGRAFSFKVADALRPKLRDYVECIRPQFPGGEMQDSGML